MLDINVDIDCINRRSIDVRRRCYM